MQNSKLFTIILFGLMLLSFSLFAEEAKVEKKDAPKEIKNQTHCPVMGGKIDSTVFTDIQGQRVYHCCPGCSNSLKKDPDTYFKKAATDGILFENIQTNCPISGEKLEKKTVYSDFDGRRIYLCCEKCISAFEKDPQKVLNDMDSSKGKVEVKKVKTEDHSGHNH